MAAAPQLTPAEALELVHELAGEYIIGAGLEGANRMVIRLEGKQLPIVARILRDNSSLMFKYLVYITCSDYETHMESIHYLRSINHRVTADLRVELDRDRPTLPSVSSIWRTACWHERETYDFFGIIYTGHPELNRILTGVKGGVHPLRKGEQPHRLRRKEWQWEGVGRPVRLPGEADRSTRS